MFFLPTMPRSATIATSLTPNLSRSEDATGTMVLASVVFPRPHGAGDGTAVLVCHHPHHHLVLVGSAVLGVAPGPEFFPARTLEVDAGGVEEDHRKGGKQVPVGLEDGLLDPLPVLSQPGHGPVEVVELYVFGPRYAVVAGYPGGSPIRTRKEQARKGSQVDGALDGEGVLPAREKGFDHLTKSQLIPDPSRDEVGPRSRDLHGLELSLPVVLGDLQLLRISGKREDYLVEVTLVLELVDPAECRYHPLA